MKKKRLENRTVTEIAEFESQLFDVIQVAREGDETAIEIMLKMKQAIGSS
ncbi:hypothetical protein WBS55_22685 [Bacillus luti]|uniref:Uncharacterized protein n=1 Tax=Bacillus luti TaxID=2026191 RepID=A0ABU8HXM8_9BACI